MTGVYIPQPEEGSQWAIPQGDGADQLYRLRHDPTTSLANWQPLRVELLRRERLRRFRRVDLPWLSGNLLAMDVTAFEALAPLIGPCVTTLSLACEEQDLVGVWANEVLDVLDESASELVRFEESQRVMAIERHAWHHDKVGGATMFRLPQLGGAGAIYLTGVVVEAVRSAGLTGWKLSPAK